MFQLISDGCCDFESDEILEHDIGLVPFYITFDDKVFLKEGIDITKEEFFDKIVSNKNLFAKTSQPNPEDYINTYKPYLEKGYDILCLTISSKVSGSYNSATIAADMLKEEFPDRKIITIDSLNGCIGQGLILREMIAMRNDKMSMDEIAEKTGKIIPTAKIYITLDTLDYLKKGGRVGPTTALVGGVLGLKPVLHVVDGVIEQLDSIRGKQRIINLLVEGVKEALQGQETTMNISVAHIDRYDETVTFKNRIEEALGISIDNPITKIGATIGTHVGPKALAVSYCKKYSAV
ncbi:MAG: DegV family protein [Defluviitaleaceae bacterium]|nr:DegV family protein [Defluviitaleaceae bacterium]